NRVQSGGLQEVGRPQRDTGEVDGIVDGRPAVFIVLNREEVIVAGLVIHPVVGRDHGVRVQGGDDVVDDFLGTQSQLRGVNTVHVQPDSRVIHVLRDVYLSDAGQPAEA